MAFDWDVDLTSGFEARFLANISKTPGTERFGGCDTPEMGKRLREGGFDAVLVMGWHLKAFWQAIWAAKRAGLPVMVRGDSHLDTPRSLAKRLIKAFVYPPALRVFDAALYVGARNRAYYEHYRFPPDRLVFAPHCVDTGWFAERATDKARRALRSRLGIGLDTKLVLFAGKLQAFKKPMHVVEAVAHLRSKRDDVHILVAGSGELGDAVERRAREAGVPVYMLGFQNQSEMPAVYAAADVLVLPSTGRETWGLVANEALACGTPVVLSDAVGAAPDLAGDGVAGRVFPVGDIGALAYAIGEMISVPPSAGAIKARSRQYSLSACCDGIEEAMRRLRG